MSDKNGNSLVGQKNRYTCRKCNSWYVTVDKDDGTTPFMAPCRVRFCDGVAQSEFYRVDQSLTATHEWYRAGDAEARGMEPNSRQHHDMGGLFLRRVPVTMTLRNDLEINAKECFPVSTKKIEAAIEHLADKGALSWTEETRVQYLERSHELLVAIVSVSTEAK
jgi:hypothetical protein